MNCTRFYILALSFSFLTTPLLFGDEASSQISIGQKIYIEHCASCHGEHGQGVADKYDETLYGDKSLDDLTRIIHDTMPEEDPEQVVSDDAKRVAEYLYDSFYTAEARAKNQPPRIELVRLTNNQYLNVVADLFTNFLGASTVDDSRGLSAEYFDSKNMSRNKRKIERTDPFIDFEFKDGSPGEGIGKEEFSIRWDGSFIAEETGAYKFTVRSENGFRMWVNNNDKALIDGWVASGGEVVEQSETVQLLGGRAYPIRLDYYKYKGKTASVELLVQSPHGIQTVIPKRLLSPKRVSESVIVSTPFPPDDASLGYERGSSVSQAWVSATTQAAMEIANIVVQRLDRLAKTNRDDDKRRDKVKDFCYRFVELAFRRPLTEEQKQLLVENQFANSEDLEVAVKRVVLLAFQSPQFLYVELTDTEVDNYDVASRMSLGLWDSLPDQQLLKSAEKGQLLNEKTVRQQAQRMVRDQRAKFKIRGFFHELLPFHEARGITKNIEQYPGFDAQLVSDLKTSIELFIDDVVWGEKSDYRELLLSSDLYLNARLGKFYDVDIKQEDGFEKIALDPKQRAGVVTHPFLLSTLAHQETTSPIHRGVFITRKILSRSLKPPPMAIEFEDSKFAPTLTMREKVAELTKSQACMTCHSTINPLGFSLENYDAVGRFRTMDKDKPIDASSDFSLNGGKTVTFTGARDVAEYAVQDEMSQRGFVEHLFQHEIKQASRAYGENILETLRSDFAASDFNIQKLIVEINVLAALHGVDQPQGKK
ncbi:DUF1592 domain-containing protein [bacterium]|nr:DUF1592 domain-containing protein [bacterium]